MPGLVYFGVNWAVIEHDKIIEVSGGLAGVPKKDSLESMLLFIQEDDYYPEFEDKLTHLIHSLAKNHYFADGNKRSSIAIGAYFLQVNGLGGIVPRFIQDMENIVLCVADDIILKQDLKIIMQELVVKGEMSEGSKLMVIEGIKEYERRELEREENNRPS